MSITIYNLKKWSAMLLGKSILHVPQNVGQCLSLSGVKGYYNDLTEKVKRTQGILYTEDLPVFRIENGQYIHFPVGIFQYGLGAYDLYLQTKEECFLNKFNQCVSWTIANQDEKGRWDNFSYIFPESPYGAMAQGQAVSLLVRAYIVTGNENYLLVAKKGIDFMLVSIENGGVTEYSGADVIFREYTCQQTVLNGWVFAWWGLYDFIQVFSGDKTRYISALNQSQASLAHYLPKFTTWYWSRYDMAGRVASPFYHNLHIAQLAVMGMITNDPIFTTYSNKWKHQQNNPIYRIISLLIKAIQKIKE